MIDERGRDMPRGKTRFTQADVARALKAAEAASFEVGAVEIDNDGKIRILRSAEKPASGDPYDVWKARRDAH